MPTPATPPSALPRFALKTLVPLCRDRFVDPVHGGFFEALSATHAPLVRPKRLLVQCRLLYVLSHAALLGERGGAGAAEVGYAFLRATYQDRTHGGFFFSATPEGAALDRSKDFYAHAFVLYALAWLHRAFAAPGAVELAGATLDLLHARLAAPHGGFWDGASEDWQPHTALRRQNPHMHLLEALLAWHAATGEERWLNEARALVRLFETRFFDPATGTLGEFFGPDWRAHPAQGHVVEPGHHFEWVWLLHRWRAQSGEAGGETGMAAAAEALYATALRHGFDPEHGGIHDQIHRTGAPLATTRRIWPLTEAIKAHLARIEAGEAVAAGEPGRSIDALFATFLRPGGWIETCTREGAPTRTELPGSTPYHVFLAAAETARVLGAG
jgi:mannose/cellobiose epimerase-like protein (N-acyl-D-glucosamine 2-epimerase family)